jgi:glycosyltransferase involved in cell wall biosynthesis
LTSIVRAGPAADPARPLRICFVSLNNYDALAGRRGHVGGMETQFAALARGLSDWGHQVSFVTWDLGQGDGSEVRGIRAYTTCRPDEGLPLLRFLHPRWTSLWKAMARAEADVYCQGTAVGETGQVAAWCRRRGKRFLFLVLSDTDCRLEPPAAIPLRHRWLRRYGLRHADTIVAQTEAQRALIARELGRTSALVRPPTVLPPAEPAGGRRAPRPRLLWVGRFSPEKRLEWFLDLAERLPGMDFDVLGAANRPTAYAEALARRAAAMPNVVLHGHVAHDEVARFYRQASLLVLTSTFEGFPSTLMEAWSHGVPTASTLDPDGVVTRHGLGAVAPSLPELAAAAQRLVESGEEWLASSRRAQAYVREHHSVEVAVAAFNRVLDGTGVTPPPA